MMRKLLILSTCLSAAFVSGCVNPQVVKPTSVDDDSLTCGEINAQIMQLHEIRRTARRGQTASIENVAAAFLFWPAVFGNYVNAAEAIEAANSRSGVLFGLAHQQDCEL